MINKTKLQNSMYNIKPVLVIMTRFYFTYFIFSTTHPYHWGYYDFYYTITYTYVCLLKIMFILIV